MPRSDTPDFSLPPSALYKAILAPSFEPYFPSRLTAELRNIVKQLLTWNSLNRLGCLTQGAVDVRAHRFYAAVDWAALEAQRQPAPFVPNFTHAADTSNFRSSEWFEQQDDNSFVREQPEYEYDANSWDCDF